jgi:phosphotransferase system enzyme I (PtsI)
MPTAATPSTSFTLKGIAVSPGIQFGKVFVYDSGGPAVVRRLIDASEVEGEKQNLRRALAKAEESLREVRERVLARLDEAHAAIYDPQAMLLHDPVLIDQTIKRIELYRENAALAFMTTIQQFIDKFAAVTDDYMASRSADILDVGNRVCREMAAGQPDVRDLTFAEDVIVLAPDLSPSDTAQMDQGHARGFATELGGPTSHTAILAKALEIPAVIGVGPFIQSIPPGAMAVIDGYEGTLTINPSAREVARARARRRRHLIHERDLQKLRYLPAETIDGYRVELSANVELPIEIPHVLSHGAEGVGLFRTEFIYLEREELPGEDDQFEVYRKVLEDVAPHPVIFRTMDIGGDKFFGNLHSREMNPFLGLRAIRLCLAHPEIFKVQLRAMLRASAFGKARIMFPMISTLREVRRAKEILEDMKRELRERQIDFDEKVPVGIMIEIPSAALCSDQLAKEVDFFSIGTNDLIQYTLAVDRGNEQVAPLYDPFHPAILRLIRMTIDAAQREGIWVGSCGEMSSNPLCALLLVGLGIDELSMGALAIPEIKRLIRQIRLPDARRVVEDIYSLRSSGEIHDYVRQAYRVIQRRRMKAANGEDS